MLVSLKDAQCRKQDLARCKRFLVSLSNFTIRGGRGAVEKGKFRKVYKKPTFYTFSSAALYLEKRNLHQIDVAAQE